MSRIRFCSRQRMQHLCPIRRGGVERLAGLLHSPVCKRHPLWGIRLSIRLINAVVESAPVKGGEYLLLLCMARYAADDGTRVFPSVATLAHDTRQHERAVQKQLRSLEAKGLIIRVGQSRHSTNNYRVAVEKLSVQGGPKPSPTVSVGAPRGGPGFNTPGPRPPDSLDSSLNRQEPVEKTRVKTKSSTEAMKAIAELLPKFKSAQQRENQ